MKKKINDGDYDDGDGDDGGMKGNGDENGDDGDVNGNVSESVPGTRICVGRRDFVELPELKL